MLSILILGFQDSYLNVTKRVDHRKNIEIKVITTLLKKCLIYNVTTTTYMQKF